MYLDETWSNDTAKIAWSDDTEKCILLEPVSKGKRIVICHAGNTEGFVLNSLLLCGKKLSESYADYHNNMNGDMFY